MTKNCPHQCSTTERFLMTSSVMVAVLAFIVILLAFGCSAPYMEEEVSEIDTLQQEYVALNGQQYQIGTQPGPNLWACGKTWSGQQCVIPRSKTIEVVWTFTDWHAVERRAIRHMIDRFTSAFSSAGYSFSLVDETEPPSAIRVRAHLFRGSVPGWGSQFLGGYRSVSFPNTLSLTEGMHPGLYAPVGQYFMNNFCVVTLDGVDMGSQSASYDEWYDRTYHAASNSVLACMGLGSRIELNLNSNTRLRVGGITQMATPGEVCRANMSDMADTNDISIVALSACPTD